MALYFKFKSAKDFSSIPIYGRYISVGEFKARIFESKIGRGKDFDLVITNAQTNEDYVDESTLIPAYTSLLIRRLPGWPRKPIVLAPGPAEDEPELKEERKSAVKGGAFIVDSQEWDDFFSSSKSLSTSSTLTTVDDEDSKIKALVDTPALEWQKDSGFNPCGGGAMGRRMVGRNIPPEGYVCHRCKVAGHFIQHCPTNGDPNYDIKKFKAPRGIPKSMLVATPEGFYGLPDGKVAVLRPDEAAFEKEVEGLPSTQCSVGDIPPELYCKICKKIMEFAVITSKCCFDSFCDKCIRNYLISKSICVCGVTNILADHLLPNLTLRNAINRILGSSNSSVENNNGSALQVPNMELHNPQPKVTSPGQSLASNKEATVPTPTQSVVSNNQEAAVASKKEYAVAHEESDAAKNEESEASKKKKRKKAHMPLDSGEMQWPAAQYLAAQNYMMSMAFAAYNPYWTAGIQPGMEGFVTPGTHAGAFPHKNFGVGPLDMSFRGVLPQEQCSRSPMMSSSRGEVESRKAVPKRKRETDRQESLKDQEHTGEVCSGDISSKKSKINHHGSARPSTDGREHDYNNYKHHSSYRDEHYHYQEDAPYQRSRHLHSLQTCH